MRFFICGSALRGQPDHGNLGGARSCARRRPKPIYRLHSVDDQHPGIYEVRRRRRRDRRRGLRDDRRAARAPARDRTAEPLRSAGPARRRQQRQRDDLSARRSSTSAAIADISHHGGWAAYKASRSRAIVRPSCREQVEARRRCRVRPLDFACARLDKLEVTSAAAIRRVAPRREQQRDVVVPARRRRCGNGPGSRRRTPAIASSSK